MDDRERRPKRKENPVREWISDNLRYLLLIFGIAVLAGAAFLIFHLVQGSLQDGQTADSSQTVTVTSSSAGEEGSSAEKTDGTTEKSTESTSSSDAEGTTDSSSAGEDKVDSSSAESTEDTDAAEDTDAGQSETAETAGQKGFTQVTSGEVYTEIDNYLNQQLTSTDNQLVESVGDIRVYTYPGEADNSYLAFVFYTYKYKGYEGNIPTLQEYYLAPDSTGELVIQSSVPASSQAYVAGVEQSADVQKLISEVQGRYDALMQANPALKQYVQSLNG